MVNQLRQELKILHNKHKYIQDVLNGDVDLRRKKKPEITEMLVSRKYDMIDDDTDFKYLTKMSMDSVTEENVEKLASQYTQKQKELAAVESTTIQRMWMNELDALRDEYQRHREILYRSINAEDTKGKSKSGTKKVLIKKKSKL